MTIYGALWYFWHFYGTFCTFGLFWEEFTFVAIYALFRVKLFWHKSCSCNLFVFFYVWNRQTTGHCDSMTESGQWGRFSENCMARERHTTRSIPKSQFLDWIGFGADAVKTFYRTMSKSPWPPPFLVVVKRNYFLSRWLPSHQSYNLASLANNLEVLQPLQDEVDVEGANCHHVNHVHRFFDEPWKIPWIILSFPILFT